MLTAQQVADAVFNPGSKTPSYKTCALRPHPASWRSSMWAWWSRSDDQPKDCRRCQSDPAGWSRV